MIPSYITLNQVFRHADNSFSLEIESPNTSLNPYQILDFAFFPSAFYVQNKTLLQIWLLIFFIVPLN